MILSEIIVYLIVGTAKGSNVSNSLRSMGTEMRPGQRERSQWDCQWCVHQAILIKACWICAHLFWDGHWRGSSASGSHLYWHSHQAVGNNTAAWFLSQSVGPFWQCPGRRRKITSVCCVYHKPPRHSVLRKKTNKNKINYNSSSINWNHSNSIFQLNCLLF